MKLSFLKGLFLFSSVCANFSAFSWWDQSHHLISLVASENISKETYDKAKKLISVEIDYPGSKILSVNTSDFDTVAGWADAFPLHKDQPTLIHHKSCHYTDLEMDESLSGKDISYDYAKQQLEKSLQKEPTNSINCLKSAIKSLTLKSSTNLEKAIALRFVIHIVGDMSQPLHNISKIANHSDDRGGNETHFPSTIWIPTTSGNSTAKTSLHSVWDGSLGFFIQFPYKPTDVKEGFYSQHDREINKVFATTMLQDPKHGNLLERIAHDEQSIEDWVIDGYQIAAKHVYSDLDLPWGVYSVTRYDIVNTQLMKASIRLTHLLNAIFDPENSSKEFQTMVNDIKNDRKIKRFLLQ